MALAALGSGEAGVVELAAPHPRAQKGTQRMFNEPKYHTTHTFAIRRKGQNDYDVIGKLVLLGPPREASPVLVLHRKFDRKRAALHKLADSLSFDERLFNRAFERGAKWIDYEVDGKLYRLLFSEFADAAIRKQHGEGWQLYVPIDYWHVVEEGPYPTEHRRQIDEVLKPPSAEWKPTTPVKQPEPPAPGPQRRLTL